jgi:hypothetical protein
MSAIKTISKQDFDKLSGRKVLYHDGIYKVSNFFKETFYKIK